MIYTGSLTGQETKEVPPTICTCSGISLCIRGIFLSVAHFSSMHGPPAKQPSGAEDSRFLPSESHD